MDPESPAIPERGLLTLSDAVWAQAVQRSQVIAPLAAQFALARQKTLCTRFLKFRAIAF
jgi:hypothetical protein